MTPARSWPLPGGAMEWPLGVALALALAASAYGQHAPGGATGVAGDGSKVEIDPNEDGTVEVTINSCAAANALVVEATTCDIGMGTASPTKPLHVVGDLLVVSDQIIVDSSGGAYVDVDSSGANTDVAIRYMNGGSSAWTTGRLANDTSFHVIDGSQAGTSVFEIEDGAPAAAVVIEADGDVAAGADLGVTGAIQGGGGRTQSVTRVTSTPYAVLAADHNIFCDSDGGDVEIDLPAGTAGRYLRIKNVGTSGNDCDVDPDGSETIDDLGAGVLLTLVDGQSRIMVYETTEGWQ